MRQSTHSHQTKATPMLHLKRALLFASSLIALGANDSWAQQARNPALGARILHIADSSRRATGAVLGDTKGAKIISPEQSQALRATQEWVLASLRAIIDSATTWPGRTMVGDSASTALARLFLQARELTLQERAVALMEKAVAAGDASPSALAVLTDRSRVAAGRQQVYGTALTMTQMGTAVVAPIADSASVDARRKAVGLGPLADSVATIKQPTMPNGVQVIKPPVR
jgi:hypothetical protein